MFEEILYEKQGSIATILINRPDRRNMVTARTRGELAQAFADAERDDEVGAVVLGGAGGEAFSAGQDVSQTREFTSDADTRRWLGQSEAMVEAMRALLKPIVAAIHGDCFNAGFHLALLSDLRIGTPRTRFAMSEVDVGLPSIKGAWHLERTVGLSRARELILTGRPVQADEALAIGLLHRVVSAGTLMDEAFATARMLASKSRTAIRLNKQRWREMTEDSLREAGEAGRRFHVEAFASGDPQQHMAREAHLASAQSAGSTIGGAS